MQHLRIILGLILSVAGLMWWPQRSRLHPFFGLIMASLVFAAIAGIPLLRVMPVMQEGMGNLLGQITLVIALGSVLGTMLEKTGGMTALSHGLLNAVGKKRSVLAMSITGAIVGIPVFCDSGFIILSRLAPQLAADASASEGSLILALSSGLYSTHTLVPPTPGPLAAATTFGLGHHMGLVMLTGFVCAIPVVAASYWYAVRRGTQITIPAHIHADESTAHYSWWSAFLPLFLPIVLISATSFSRFIQETNPVRTILEVVGHPSVALLIGVLLSFRLLKPAHQQLWPDWISDALKDAGIILLITGAGGAFGSLIKESGIGSLIGDLAKDGVSSAIFISLAWLIAALLKTSQGSSTSAMVITSALTFPLTAAAGLTSPSELAILVVAIGGGSMAVSHSNDSYFWVVSQFGHIQPRDGFRYFTPMTLLQGVTALISSILALYIIRIFP
ncbi:MAG: GntP family permease [Bacteroidetes bacterium]|nr:GntP family permease [Bacteroidota bacterium]